ncbi:glycosyltransferase [Mycobacterium sp. 236(2023)]|uniref:glycosyltransferase n=1 Tax=Mycobacterium sp. 236(2023) TaxID=3038163 RepID=UPI002414FDD7|nr:glycosyltransferase [Mycobacterium sp. 236(2023)]MDG4663661.1 glycosyltransferase [Mycobacterium sp. 236(2023)]
MLAPAVRQSFTQSVRFGVLSTFPPTPCGVARFSAVLSQALCDLGSDVAVVRITDGDVSSSDRIVGELVNDSQPSVAACIDRLNQADVALIHYQHGMYGGAHDDEILAIVAGLRTPTMVVVHSVLKTPAPHQRWVLEQLVSAVDRVVVMSVAARELLCSDYGVARHKVVTVPHGGTIPDSPRPSRAARPIILTWGLLHRGKGIERVIDAMESLDSVAGRPRYLVLGQTHPKALAAEGEAYRESLLERVRSRGLTDSVSIDPRYYDTSTLTRLVQSARVVVLPYDSRDQVTSGVLVDAIAAGRPVVATAFPHAVELLSGGAGVVVDHDDPEALASALRRVLTKPRLAGEMAAEARKLATNMAWPVVAEAYLNLARHLLAQRRALH